MSVGGSLQLPHGTGFFLNHGQSSRYKIVEARTWARLRTAPLSSDAMRQDGWSLHVTDRTCKPFYYIPRRYNVFMCRSFAIPSSANKFPLLEATTLALTRSCNALRETPLVIQLVPVVGVIAFAVWGLEPLMRHSRNLFLQRNDTNWKKSTTYYVFTSYLQPLLLWTGATLICRMLDPIVLPSEASQAVKQRLLTFVRSLSAVLAFAYCLSSLIQQTQKFFLERNVSSDTRNMGFQFAGKAVYTAVWVAAVSLFMELLGFSTQKWITAGGLGTVLLTLAGREIFTNFLSSIMIHATRPFVANEWIQTKIEGYEVSGTVEHVGWWSPTIIRGEDREAVHIPNHQFTVNVVRNLSQKTHWRIKTHLAISHLDVNKINNIVADMRKVLAKNPQVEHKRLHRRVFLENINPENQALLILISCFVKTSHFEEYLCVKEAILLDLLRVISHHKARLATPIRTVQKIYGDANIENVPFSETIFTRAGAATDRPLLLIEPPTRINGNDKAKSRPPPRASEEQTTKVSTASEPEVAPVSEGIVQNNSDQLQQKAKSGDALSKNIKVDPSAASASASYSSSKSQPEGLEMAGLGSKVGGENPPSSEAGVKEDGIPHKVNAKHESERLPVTPSPMARPALEDNIVLGVALEGSKRTLPIEDGMGLPPMPADAKELAASRSGSSGPSSAIKDKKEGQIPTSPGSAANDQRDQER